jgi:hypothetical protein
MRIATTALKKDIRIMRTPEDASKLSQQVFWNKKIQGDARSPFQRFKELNRSKCSRCSKPADENGAKRLELLEPLEPNRFNDLNDLNQVDLDDWNLWNRWNFWNQLLTPYAFSVDRR